MRASSIPPAIGVGQTLDDKYQVLDVLGEGTMGTVYSAWHLGLEQRVAIKVLRRGDAPYEAVARQRFRREARAAARIQSEFICRVLDTGTLADDTPYLVMEHLEGRDLSQELAERGRLEIAEAIRYVRQTCIAVAEAHRCGIVHRDLKPANLFLQQSARTGPSIKVLDFGVSKNYADKAQDMSLTRASALVGSPLYMSPEQLDSEQEVDGRTDIWALGAILIELITGVPPFDEESIAQLVSSILHRATPTFAERGCHVPLGLEAVLQKAMHKDRAQRYQTADEMAEALLPFEGLLDPRRSLLTQSGAIPLASSVPVHSIANGVVPTSSQTGAQAVSAQVSQMPSAPRRQHGKLAAVLLAGVLLGALTALAFRGERVAHTAPPVLPSPPKQAAVVSTSPVAPAVMQPVTERSTPTLSPESALTEATGATSVVSAPQPVTLSAPQAAEPTAHRAQQGAQQALASAVVAGGAQQLGPSPTSEPAQAAAASEAAPQEVDAPLIDGADVAAAIAARVMRATAPVRPAQRPREEPVAPAAPEASDTSDLPNFGGRR